jgi:hypothetical protein
MVAPFIGGTIMIRLFRLSRFITVASLAVALLVLTGCGKKIANNFG